MVLLECGFLALTENDVGSTTLGVLLLPFFCCCQREMYVLLVEATREMLLKKFKNCDGYALLSLCDGQAHRV
jgi:hypothetical protein